MTSAAEKVFLLDKGTNERAVVGVGQVVYLLAFFSDGPSSNPLKPKVFLQKQFE